MSASEAVRWVCAADPSNKPAGAVTYTPLCNVKGGVEADLTVSRLGDERYYFAAGGSTATKDWEWIANTIDEKFGGEERGAAAAAGGLELVDLSDQLSMLSVQGPHSKRLLERVFSAGSGSSSGSSSDCDVQQLPRV